MTIEVEVCVVGAGPVGGTLACLLAEAGIATAVVDQAALPPMEHPDFDGRAYAIAAGSRAVLERAGLWARLPFVPGAIRDIRVSDGRLGRPASRLFLHFDSREVTGGDPGDGAPGDGAPGDGDPGDGEEGAFGWMVEARSLRMALNAALHETQNLSVHAPARATVTRGEANAGEKGAVVRLADGTEIRARLVVAAEGRRSALRDQAGIAVTHLPDRQTGIVCAIGHELPHEGTALEHFLPGGPFAQLPMAPSDAGENISAIVWTERTRLAERMLALDDAGFTDAIRRRLGDHLGDIRLLGRRWHYPLAAMIVHRLFATRLAVVGDAAHGIHPIAGQGLNLGFRDIDALAELIVDADGRGEDVGSTALLRRYQARRRPDNMAMLLATDALDRLFSNDNPVLRLARDVGLAGVQRMPRLKRMFMRQAMGRG